MDHQSILRVKKVSTVLRSHWERAKEQLNLRKLAIMNLGMDTRMIVTKTMISKKAWYLKRVARNRECKYNNNSKKKLTNRINNGKNR